MGDQAEMLRRLVRELDLRSARPLRAAVGIARQTRVVGVSGGKGGVGKSTVALNLGLALGAAGRKVLLVDADLGLASLDVMLGLEAEHSLEDVALDDMPVEQATIPVARGLDLLPGSSGAVAMADLRTARLDRLVQVLSRAAGCYDLVLVDTAAGASESVRAFLRSADRVVIVTCPEPTAITDAYALAKLLAREGQTRLGVLVNMARSEREGERVGARLADVARRYAGVRIAALGSVPHDWEVAAAVRERKPLLTGRPNSAASAALKRAAWRFWQWLGPAAPAVPLCGGWTARGAAGM